MPRQFMFTSAALVAACAAPGLSPTQQARLVAACDVDGKVIPLAQTVVASMGVPGATASAIDRLLVHPAVLAECEKLRGTPTVTVTETPI